MRHSIQLRDACPVSCYLSKRMQGQQRARSLFTAKEARALLAKAPARFLLISDLRARIGKVDNLDQILGTLAERLKEHGVRSALPEDRPMSSYPLLVLPSKVESLF